MNTDENAMVPAFTDQPGVEIASDYIVTLRTFVDGCKYALLDDDLYGHMFDENGVAYNSDNRSRVGIMNYKDMSIPWDESDDIGFAMRAGN